MSNNQIYLVNAQDGNTININGDDENAEIEALQQCREAPINGIHWSPDGKSLIYNRYVFVEDDYYIQIFQRLIPSA